MTIRNDDSSGESSAPELWFPFYGGLGDLFIRCYKTRFWHCLETYEERVGVVLASVNPYAGELFRWHRNPSRLVVYELSHAFSHFTKIEGGEGGRKRALAGLAGVDWPGKWQAYNTPPPEGWRPTFYAPDYLDDSGHFVFHPFAGLNHRALPSGAVLRILRCLGRLPCNVYIPSRDFVRFHGHKVAHGVESLPDTSLPRNVTILKNLSVPATLNLIRNARGFIGTHSALVHAAAYEGIPSLSLYPGFLANDFDQACGHAYYTAMEHMTAAPLDTVDEDLVDQWIANTFDSVPLANGWKEKEHVDELTRWIFSSGGKVNIDYFCRPDFAEDDRTDKRKRREIASVDQLPSGRYQLWRVHFGGCKEFSDRGLISLREFGKGIGTISHLNLYETSVTAAGIDSLDWLGSSLRKIRLPKHLVDRRTTAKIRSLLPDCIVV